ncbi:MAG: hypothetical protein KHX03_04910 [Clostridium sp.]|nr:hypothetical protein [Clostridium sp.]
MKTFLLLDFGASRVKTAVLSDDKLFDIRDYEPVKPCVFAQNRFEVDLFGLKNQFLSILKDYSKEYNIDIVLICSEMHGFALLNNNNEPESNYISWKDERCLEKIEGVSSLDLLKQKLKNKFFEKTGMKERACYPVFNLFHMIREDAFKHTSKGCIKGEIKVVSLPEWLACAGGKSLNIAHCTMSAGLGFYNIRTKSFDEEIISAVTASSNVSVTFNRSVENIAPAGFIEMNGKSISIYTGVGDHQCALYGAGLKDNCLSLNLGTGSQAALIGSFDSSNEKRPYFDSKILTVITHIPSGRAFNYYKEMLEKTNPEIDFWKELSSVSLDDINKSDLNINLAVFQSAWNYGRCGEILAFDSSKHSIKNYFASIMKSYINQYFKAIETLVSSNSVNQRFSVILSGGVAKKLPVIKEYFTKFSDFDVIVTNSEYDETLEGLKKLSACII